LNGPRPSVVRPGFPGVGLLESAMLLSHQDTGGRGYTAEFRQRVLDLVAGGRRVEDIARDLGYQRPNGVRLAPARLHLTLV